MQDLILLAGCFLITNFIGWNLLYLLAGRKRFGDFSFPEKIGLSCLFGFGIISIQMFIMGFLGLEFTRFNILCPWLFIIAINLLVWGSSTGANSTQTRMGTPHIFSDEKMRNVPLTVEKMVPIGAQSVSLVFLIAVQTLYNFFRAVIKPIESYDAVAIYGLKAKIMYYMHSVNAGFFKSAASNFKGAHADYPLLIPLSETWIYTFIDKFDDILVKAVFPLFFLAFIFIFYAILKRITASRNLSLLFTFFLASIKQFSDYSTIGVADFALGIYFAVSLFYLYLWFEKKENASYVRVSLVSLILCLWTKNEGTFLALSVLFVLLSYMIREIKKIGRREILSFFAYGVIIFAAILFWNMFKKYHNLANENLNLSMVSIKNLILGFKKMPVILYEYQRQLFGFNKWNIMWILFIFILLKRFKTALSNNIIYITVTFFIFGIGYTLAYIFAMVDIGFIVRSTWSRFLLHILPLAMFWLAIIVDRTRQKRIAG